MRQVRKFSSIDERDAAYVANPNIDTLSYVSEDGSVRRRRAEDSLGEVSVEIRQLTDTDGPAPLGQSIELEFVVTNTGIVDLENLVLVSERTGDNWGIDSLAIGETDSVYPSVTIDEFDILDGCIVDFTVSATATVGPDPQPVTKTFRIVTDEPNRHVTVEARDSINGEHEAALAETVAITVTVTNDGNVTLDDVFDVECERTGFLVHIQDFQPGESSEFTDYVTITETDILNCEAEVEYVPNVSQVGGFDVGADPGTVLIETEDPSGHLTCYIERISADPGRDYHEGDVISLQVSVRNDGNLTVTDGTVIGERIGLEEQFETIQPGETLTWPASYTVIEEDVLAGNGVLTVTASGTSPDPDEPDVPVTPGEFEFPVS